MKISHLTMMIIASFPAAAAASTFTASVYSENCYRAAWARNASEHAMESCNRALAEQALIEEDRVATHVNRGILHLVRANVREANTDFDSALALDPNDPEAWLNKAVAQARFGRTTDALPMVEKALALSTRRPALAYFVRAMVQEDSGNVRGAYHDLQRARDLEPAWKEPQIELRRFQVR